MVWEDLLFSIPGCDNLLVDTSCPIDWLQMKQQHWSFDCSCQAKQ
jgi:hypothetical protein